ncbi:MAG TPA: hypothetical protein H9784_10380 [Candidatus Desulfovibrio intestinavium]|uniref:Head decoration protein n=1 Tax=Candidatus Desulfovibrio intestinavium TaxID=2838534 RepID=A0A9D2KT04_9BACT|nr:hypothetical protein [Candidatus Desulfovibrio intestinavium]
MNEGFLGKHTLSGERAATGDHPVVLHHLPLSAKAKAAVIPVGTVMKRVDIKGEEDESDTVVDVAWEPLLSTDAATALPVAVVDTPCDPTGENGETSALCVVHGGVKNRLLTTGDSKALTAVQMAQLVEHGIFPA